MKLPNNSEIDTFVQSNHFLWATGIEDTFITAVSPRTGRSLDEYELTGHYERWEEDIRLIAQLGVQCIRYGIPWHRVNPASGEWDWDWTDRVMDGLLDLGIHPIIDLVHYGVPAWIEHAFLNPDYPQRVAEYAARFAERFRDRVSWYTPLNEPRIAAWYCGKLGWWPPFRRNWSGFVDILLSICRGVVRTEQAIRAVDPNCVLVHVDATDLYSTTEIDFVEEANRRQHIVFLPLDLITGLFDETHPLWAWAIGNGLTGSDVAFFKENALVPDIIGLNMYPMFTMKQFVKKTRGMKVRMPYANAELVDRLVEMYWRRYRRPIMITETASLGSVSRRSAWLHASIEAVRNLRRRGVPIIGYTWWPLFALVAWAYRQGKKPAGHYLLQMGLWDLRADATGNLQRMRTPLVDEYREIAASDSELVGTMPSLLSLPT